MNGNEEDPQSDPKDSGTMISTGTATYSAYFKQDPNYEFEHLYLDTSVNIVATCHLDFDKQLNRLSASLRDKSQDTYIGGATLNGVQGDNVYTFEFKPEVEMVTNHLEFLITFKYEQVGSVSYTFYTDGSSHITLPLLWDTDSDGNPDIYDEDDDDDGFSDVDEMAAGTDDKDPTSYPENGGNGGNGGGGGSGSYGTEFTFAQFGLVLAVIIAIIVVIYLVVRRRRANG